MQALAAQLGISLLFLPSYSPELNVIERPWVVRYVNRNSLRAGLVERVQDWRWSSLRPDAEGPALDPGPVPRGPEWLAFVNTPMTEAEVAAIRLSPRRDRPYGTDSWTSETDGRLGLEYSLRPRGRHP